MDVAAGAVRGDEDQDEGESAAPGHSTGSSPAPDESAHAQALLQGNYGIIPARISINAPLLCACGAMAAARVYRYAFLELYPPLTSRERRQRPGQTQCQRGAGGLVGMRVGLGGSRPRSWPMALFCSSAFPLKSG